MAIEPTSFFRNLGLLARPLFDSDEAPLPASKEPWRHYALLDGARTSFALSISGEAYVGEDDYFYDWAWSAHVPHHVEITGSFETADGLVLVRRWDTPGHVRRFPLKSVIRHGGEFLQRLQAAGDPRGRSVIGHALGLFRLVRQTIGSGSSADTQTIRAFHALLRGVAAVRTERSVAREWLSAKTLHESMQIAGLKLSEDAQPQEYRLPLGLLDKFISREPSSGRTLDARLLLRHAAGALYQEAHLEVEQSSQRFLIAPGLASAKGAIVRRDVVYTPPGLARLLAEYAWRLLRETRKHPTQAQDRQVTILDPACGSGVFLIEALQLELDARKNHRAHSVNLLGMDVSEAAVQMASFALGDLVSPSAGVESSLQAVDALEYAWPKADIILMNPPFVAWEDLSPTQRERVLSACGNIGRGRPDLAMAFVSMALNALRPGGVLATVLPSALLETTSGVAWRQQILDETVPHVVARFVGNDLFPTAMVEPAVLVVQKPLEGARADEQSVTMALSKAGQSDAAIRALRRGYSIAAEQDDYEVYEVSAKELGAISWLPRPQQLRDIVIQLESRLARAALFFDVQQGIRSGADKVFVLPVDRFKAVPAAEKHLFRPLAGNRALHDGALAADFYIFYPYGDKGPLIATEGDLAKIAPWTLRTILAPNERALRTRAGITGAWWELTRPRNWQFRRFPKIVSSYFGKSGKFAFDERGEFVVGQGFAWLFSAAALVRAKQSVSDMNLSGIAQDVGGEGIEDVGDVITRAIGPSYVALFNSLRFEHLLSYYSQRVLGGQFDLSPRFVNNVPVPDFFTPGAVSADVVLGLRRVAERMRLGPLDRKEVERREELVSKAYGINAARWPLEFV